MKKKYSENFERDYKFYFENRHQFTFCGTLTPKFKAIPDNNGKNAKEVFFLIDSQGKNVPTKQPKLLNEILMCKASINFFIKQWAESRSDGTLPFDEFAGDGEVLEWKTEVVKHKHFGWLPKPLKRLLKIEDKLNAYPFYNKSIAKLYNFPEWAIKAVEMQKIKLISKNKDNPDWFVQEAKNQKQEYSDKNFTFL